MTAGRRALALIRCARFEEKKKGTWKGARDLLFLFDCFTTKPQSLLIMFAPGGDKEE